MKTLLLLRHGKSSWSDASLADHDRPLKKRGIEAAKRMGQLLTELNLVPEHIWTSSAARATATVQLVVEATKYAGEVEVEPKLYQAGPVSFLATVSQTSDQVDRVLVVGHNPGMEELLADLIGHFETFPTAALARVELPIERWINLSQDTRGTLHGLWRPKELPSEGNSLGVN